MKIPNFDDIDLGIIAITVIMLVIAIALAMTAQIKDGLGIIGTGVTAIATLAGRKIKDNSANKGKE